MTGRNNEVNSLNLFAVMTANVVWTERAERIGCVSSAVIFRNATAPFLTNYNDGGDDDANN